MEKINTDCKRRIWKLKAKLFNLRKPWRAPLNSYESCLILHGLCFRVSFFSTSSVAFDVFAGLLYFCRWNKGIDFIVDGINLMIPTYKLNTKSVEWQKSVCIYKRLYWKFEAVKGCKHITVFPQW